MKEGILLMVSIFFIFVGCSKDEVGGPDCNSGEVRFVNNDDDPYNFYIDGAFVMVLNGSRYLDRTLPKGHHSWTAIQRSGYILFPKERYGEVNVFGCDEYTVTFP